MCLLLKLMFEDDVVAWGPKAFSEMRLRKMMMSQYDKLVDKFNMKSRLATILQCRVAFADRRDPHPVVQNSYL